RASLAVLLELPPTGNAVLPALRLLRRLENEPNEQATRSQIVTLLNSETGRSFKIEEQGSDAASLKRAYQPIFAWVTQKYPALLRRLDADDQEETAQWDSLLKRVAWNKGDAQHGQAIFVAGLPGLSRQRDSAWSGSGR